MAFIILSSVHLFAPSVGNAGTDSELFKKGVASFQKNRYQEAIRSLTSLLQANPKTPLRDMTLYYLARSHLKSGQGSKAAAITAQLMREFPASYNRGTIDSELLKALDSGASKSAVPPPQSEEKKIDQSTPARNEAQKPLPAQPLKDRKVTAPRTTAAAKHANPQTDVLRKGPEKEVSHREKAKSRNVPALPLRKSTATGVQELQKVPAKRSQRTQKPDVIQELDVAGKMTATDYASVVGKGTAPFHMELSSEWAPALAGSTVSIPFTIINHDAATLKLRLSSQFPPFFLARFTSVEGEETGGEITVVPGVSYRGVLTLAVPSASVDGARFSYPIEVRHGSFSVSRDAGIIVSAPLLRAVIKARAVDSVAGNVACTVTLLNAGSATAEDLYLKVVYAPSLEPLEEDTAGFTREDGALVRDGVRLEPGGLLEYVTRFRMDGTAEMDSLSFRLDLMDRRLGTGASVRSAAAVLENGKQD